MQCVLVSKSAYQSLAWPVMFSELVARAGEDGIAAVEVGGRALTTLSGSPEKATSFDTPKDHALLYEHGRNGLAYLAYQNW